MSPKTKTGRKDLIPLHAGCNIYVSKGDLIRIFTKIPSMYVSKLADLIFGEATLMECLKTAKKDRLKILDSSKLNSFIIHVVEVFKRQEIPIDEDGVRKYLKVKISRLAQKLKKT